MIALIISCSRSTARLGIIDITPICFPYSVTRAGRPLSVICDKVHSHSTTRLPQMLRIFNGAGLVGEPDMLALLLLLWGGHPLPMRNTSKTALSNKIHTLMDIYEICLRFDLRGMIEARIADVLTAGKAFHQIFG